MTTFTFSTDDAELAAKLFALANGAPFTAPNALNTAPAAEQPAPAAAPASILPVAAAAPVAPTGPSTEVPPPAAVAPPVAPAAPTLTDADQKAIDIGWTVDHIKAAATALVQKLGNGGPAALKAVLQKFGAECVVNGPSPLAPANYPAVHAELTALAQ